MTTETTDALSPERLAGPAPDLLTVDDALARIVANFAPLSEHERVPVLDAVGRVLVEDIPADIDLPPFDNSAMDGYAVRAEDIASATPEAPVTLEVVGEIAAGRVATAPLRAERAYRILTGGAMPVGADTVVPYEDTDGSGFGGWSGEAGALVAAAERMVRVFVALPRGENVRYKGEDQARGSVVLRAGSVVRPAEAAVLTAVGRTRVWVYRRPRIAILSTGDELRAPGEALGPGQIYDANLVSLQALVRHYGGEAISLGTAPDSAEAIRERLMDGAEAGADLIVTSGGVSMGEYDLVKRVLQDEGSIAFWSIDMRPGKPVAFGRVRGVPVLGLPGNPVSSMVTFELFVRPCLLRLAGHHRLAKVELEAVALHSIQNRSGRENFMRGIVERRASTDAGSTWAVRLTGEQGSNIITSMARANALVRLPKARTTIEPGEKVRVLMLDWSPLW